MASQQPLSTDDLFASLGGSLMKDLWADLQADDTEEDEAIMGWSLEQLERELAHLEDDGLPPPTAVQPPTPGAVPSGAFLVVSHAQERMAHQVTQPVAATPTTLSAADAWSLSLQNLTSTYEQDFLAADSARKQTSSETDELLRNVQDYNVSEVVTAQSPSGLAFAASATTPARPPGMPSPMSKQKGQVVETVPESVPAPPWLNLEGERTVAPDIPPPKRVPPTPQNSALNLEERRRPPPTPQNSEVSSEFSSPIPTPVIGSPVMLPSLEMQQQPATMASPSPKQQAWQARPPPPQAHVVVMPRKPVYCHPHPAAPPIPSAALESSMMTPRDVAYVLHSMLKPILIAGVSPDDYDILNWERRTGMHNTRKNTPSKNLEKEMNSRSQRSKEWMATHSTLGYVTKTDVTRPRAIIAVHSDDESIATYAPNKERASLWKARLYADQGYQAYFGVVQIWRAAPPGTGVPREIQPHLVKLLKCLGVRLEASPSTTYVVDETALSLLLKLPKGQILLARILEQALLPPNSVQALLPVALKISINSPLEEARLFRSFATVISTLPKIDKDCILECVKAAACNEALSSTARMECVHALLRRGQALSIQDVSFAPEWTRTEEEFMKLLG